MVLRGNTVFSRLFRLAAFMAALYVLPSVSHAAQQAFTIDQLDSHTASASGATVLHRSVNVQVAEDGLTTTEYFVRVWIHDEKAVLDYGQIEIERNRFLETLNIDMARVHTPDGEVKYLAKDAMQVQSLSEENAYFDNERVVFSLPALQPGAVIEFAYTRQQIKPILPGHFSTSHSFYWWESQAGNMAPRLDPVVSSEVHVQYPEALKLAFRQSPLIRSQPVAGHRDGQRTLHWHGQHLPAFEPQGQMPNTLDHHPLVVLSSIPDWSHINSWTQSLTAPKIQANAAIKRVADQIAAQYKERAARIEAVHAFLEAKVRYVFAHVGRGGYEPHRAQAVLENGYGDCKDQSVLAITLLRELGIEAYPALVNTKGRGLDALDLPTMRFDHMFVYIPASDEHEAIWFDTTGDQIDYPGLHWTYVGQQALVIDGSSAQLIPVKPAYDMQHMTDVALQFRFDGNNDVYADLSVSFSGLMGQHIRNMLRYTPDPQAFVKEALAPIYPMAKLSKIAFRHNPQRRDGVTLSAQLAFKDVWQGQPHPMNFGLGVHQVLNLGTYWSGLLPPEKRVQHFLQDAAFTVNLRANIPPPAPDYTASVLSTGHNEHNPFYLLNQRGEHKDDGSFEISAKLDILPVALNPEEYGDYYQRVSHAYESAKWAIQFSPSATTQATEHPDDTQAANIHALLDEGDFNAAHQLAMALVEVDATNANAHYLLALSLAYLQRYNDSNAALQSAVELGFEL